METAVRAAWPRGADGPPRGSQTGSRLSEATRRTRQEVTELVESIPNVVGCDCKIDQFGG